MWQVTALRISLVVFIGILLLVILLYMADWQEGSRLKKRRGYLSKNQDYNKNRIIIAYVTLLTFLIILVFIIIKFNIRGAL